MIPSPTARTRQREQGALKDKGIDLMVMPEGLKGTLLALTGSQRQQSAEWADKPGSVVNGHLSCLHVTVQLHARYPNADRAGP